MTPTLFIKILDGRLVLWDYQNHKQFLIRPEHASRLLELVAGFERRDDAIDKEITEADLLSNIDPQEWGWDCLSRIFHVGTQVPRKEHAPEPRPYLEYIRHCASVADRIPENEILRPGPITPLPPPQAIVGRDFDRTLRGRKTCRSFLNRSIPFQDVANTLWATFGAVHGGSRTDLEQFGMRPVGYRRTSPSGGSMQPSEPYLLAFNVGGLAPGIYHYRSLRHELSYIAAAPDMNMLCDILCGQTAANDLAYGVFVTSRFDKLWWKYPHSRAYRVALMDVGCLVQTFQLVSTALGIQTWPTGYFIDADANALLAVDGIKESVLFFLGAGYGDGPVARDALAAMRYLSEENNR
ncbi:hypothetical protein UC34_24355 [Pandoraea vervacti]|uniref:Nitroreductase domain-containing protein n=2 Tax=Pandoraea vervacti TaxID=656178 RepID=A0ABM5T5D6_9BURK|nr:hypothetical protein UC34_24355 [Pandoraea vervacti]